MKIPKVLTICFVLCCLFAGNVFAVVDVEGCIEITKEADRTCSTVGDTINYTITITNCGYEELQILSLGDSLLGPLDGMCDPLLFPGVPCMFDVPYTVQEGDPDLLINEVTVRATAAYDGVATFNGGFEVTASDTAEVTLVHPELEVDVECVTNGIPVPDGPETTGPVPGGLATFEVCVRNTGTIPLDIQQSDCQQFGPLPIPPTLEPGQGECVFVEVPLEGVGPCGTGGFAELVCTATATIPPEYCELPNELVRSDADICETPPCEPTLSVDIKPTSCPNPLRARGKGVLPVAILGTEDFDVTTIDVLTITLAGVSPIRSSFEDVATPLDKEDECECTTEGPDGYLDLTLKFDKRQIVEALGDLSLLPRRSVIPLTLRGKLMDNDVLILEGTDCIVFLNLRQR